MVKAINQQLMSPGTALFYFVGLSTDTKPTGTCDNQRIFNGSVFDEIDTGKEYLYDESGVRWYEQPEGSKKKDDPTAEEISVSRGAADAGKVIVVGEDGKLLPVDLDSTGAVAIDRTLKVSGAAADAKETGDALASLNGSLDAQKSGKMFISGDFSYGVFTNNFPESDPRKFNAITVNAEHYDRDIIVSAKTGYNFLAYFYDSNDVYVERTANWVTSVSVPAGSYFRLWVRENPLDASVILDLGTIKENIVFDTELHDEVLKNADDVEKCILNIYLNGDGKKLIDTTFVWGKMNTTTGEVQIDNTKYQVIMPNSVVYDHDVILKCNAGYRYQVWWYDANDVYISRTARFKTSDEEYTVSAGTYFRLFVTLDPPNISAVADPSVFAKNVFIGTKLGKRVKNVEENTLSTLPPYILNTLSYKPLGSLSKGYILMSCDDGTEGLVTYTIPMLINKGVPCTFGLLSSSVVVTNQTYLATLVDAVTFHGCCVALHGSAQWTTYTEKELADYLNGLKDTLETAGITRISGAICPGGNGADTSSLVEAVAGGLCGAVFSGNRIDKIAYGSYKANGARTNMYDLDRYSAIGFTSATYQQAIDDAYDNHYVLCPFWHDYSIVNDTAKQAIIEGMIDYALTKGLTFITMADLANIT